jgi:glycogen synthase
MQGETTLRSPNMRIVITSRTFYPDIGGGETNAELLAREFTAAGYEVRVITQTAGDKLDASGQRFPFDVVRRPSPFALIRQIAWADAVLQNGFSLRYAWPLIIVRKPLIIRHLVWIRQENERMTWQIRLKMLLLRFAHSISISRAIADHLPVRSQVIGNPYRHRLFRRIEGIERNRDIAFLGRLVSDKGADVLIRALAELRELGTAATATIIGRGPEEPRLRELARELKVKQSVCFAGALWGEELVKLLNAHKVLVIPSTWHEPFGVVALEGAACGCVIVGSDGGGLPEAIGPCGETFPSGDHRRLAALLRDLLSDAPRLERYRDAAPAHLPNHRADQVAEKYIQFVDDVLRQPARGSLSRLPAPRLSCERNDE